MSDVLVGQWVYAVLCIIRLCLLMLAFVYCGYVGCCFDCLVVCSGCVVGFNCWLLLRVGVVYVPGVDVGFRVCVKFGWFAWYNCGA